MVALGVGLFKRRPLKVIPYQRWWRVEPIYIIVALCTFNTQTSYTIHITKPTHMSDIQLDISSLPRLQLTNYHTTEHIWRRQS